MESVNIQKALSAGEATKQCSDGGVHDFKFVMHMDGRETFSNVYECQKCGEFAKKTQERKGLNKELWR